MVSVTMGTRRRRPECCGPSCSSFSCYKNRGPSCTVCTPSHDVAREVNVPTGSTGKQAAAARRGSGRPEVLIRAGGRDLGRPRERESSKISEVEF